MRAVLQRQGPVGGHLGQGQGAVEMGEKGAAARHLPFQGLAQLVGLDGGQHQPLDPGEVFRRRLGGLFGGREVDITVGQVDGGAGGLACGHEVLPFGSAEDLVNQHGAAMPRNAAPVNGAAWGRAA